MRKLLNYEFTRMNPKLVPSYTLNKNLVSELGLSYPSYIDPGYLLDHSILFRVEQLLLSLFSRYLDFRIALYVFEREPRALFK